MPGWAGTGAHKAEVSAYGMDHTVCVLGLTAKVPETPAGANVINLIPRCVSELVSAAAALVL